jgi:hypothetical protein
MTLNINTSRQLCRVDTLCCTQLQSVFELQIVHIDGEYSAGLAYFSSLEKEEIALYLISVSCFISDSLLTSIATIPYVRTRKKNITLYNGNGSIPSPKQAQDKKPISL